jgi:enoyl-CoA hydratase/carnithine racemase
MAALCGEARARDLFLTARPVRAEEAHRWGLVDRLVAREDVLPRALDLAAEIAELAPLAVRGMRRSFELLLRRRVELAAADAAELEQIRRASWASRDAAEALAAFADKREPVFRGE